MNILITERQLQKILKESDLDYWKDYTHKVAQMRLEQPITEGEVYNI